ncbi:MAG TPA: biotin transporter BioY [Candidatus Omnitrophota bacterium]|nr:biotin transporter BioY [Candidatus Omnitrophota bacterium]
MQARTKVLSDVWFGSSEYPRTLIKDLFLSFAFSLLIAACSQVMIPLPFSPVPITGQTFAVVLAGLVLGRNRALAAMMMYVFEGVLGLPVFSPGGAFGIARLLGPTGGYIIGFMAAAYFAGYMAEKGWDRSFFKMMLVMIGALALIYSFGMLRLAAFIPMNKVLLAGLLPFLPGEIIKMTLVSASLPAVWKLIKD